MEALVLVLLAVLLDVALLAGHIRGDRVACRPGYAPSKVIIIN